MNTPSFTLDTLTNTDTRACWQLSQALRWPHREADWRSFITWAQAQGTALAVRAEGRLIGCGLAWEWGRTQGSIGMVIVDEAWQRRGIGRRLFGSLLHALEGRSVTLQATAQGRPLYESLGFRAIGQARQFHGHWQPSTGDAASAPVSEHTTDDMAAPPAAPPASLPASLPTSPPTAGDAIIRPPAGPVSTGGQTRLLQPQDMPALLAYDQRERGLERAWLLQGMLARMSADERCAVSLDEHGQLCGYGLLRRFGRGWVVGPLLADSAIHAMALVQLLTRERTGDFVRIDLAAGTQAFPADIHLRACARPDSHEHCEGSDADTLARWLQAQGLALVDQPTTMVRPAPPRQHDAADVAATTDAGANVDAGTNADGGAGAGASACQGDRAISSAPRPVPARAPTAPRTSGTGGRTATLCALAAQALG